MTELSTTGPGSSDGTALLQVTELRVEVPSGGLILEDVGVAIARGQVLGLVGESGSGKTTLALALFGYSRRGTRIAHGRIQIDGTDVLGRSERELQRLRGHLLAYVPQDPAAALNPGRRISRQLGEAIRGADPSLGKKAVSARISELLEAVQLPTERAFVRRFPHQLSGGQMQRVVIAMSLAGDPPLLVMDEPTTALDVTTQARILALVTSIAQRRNLGILYVTHDLAVVAHLATSLAVMYAGEVIESGPASSILATPRHPYTQGLVAAAPELGGRTTLRGMFGRAPDPWSRTEGCLFAPRCPWAVDTCREVRPTLDAYEEQGVRVACLRVPEVLKRESGAVSAGRSGAESPQPSHGPAVPFIQSNHLLMADRIVASYRGHEVVHEASIRVDTARCLTVVGESGSGKTTLARAIAGLHREATGHLELAGRQLGFDARRREPAARLAIQYVFQNPYASLNPRRTIRKSLAQPLGLLRNVAAAEARRRVQAAMEQVELPLELLNSYPDELSGGQRQRVAIARALVGGPDVLICDEVTSALDVSVQAAVVEMLLELKRARGLAMIFITHNIALASAIADDIMVLKDGETVEFGTAHDVLQSPKSDYCRALMRDTPSFEAATRGAPGLRK